MLNNIVKKATLLLLIASIHFDGYHGGKILFSHGPQSLTHFRSLLPLAKRLAERGHDVTIFHSFENAHKQVNNSGRVNVIPIHREPPNKHIAVFTRNIWKVNFHAGLFFVPCVIIGNVSTSFLQLHTSEIVDVLNTDWDLIVATMLFNVHTRAFVEILARERGIPHAVMSVTPMYTSNAYKLSMGQPIAALPALIKPTPRYFDEAFDVTDTMTRFANIFEHFGDYLSAFLVDYVFYPPMLRVFGAPDFDPYRFVTAASLAFNDMPNFMSFPAPQVTSVRSTGAYCAQPSRLTQEFRSFIEDPASKGTIYIAFGTLVAWDYAPDKVKRDMFDALNELTDYRVIFAFKGVLPPELRIPAHLRVVSWAPQLDILSHPSTKVFLTHGGLKSVKEGICTATPMLVLPLFAEQGRNAQLLIWLGMGGALNKYALSAEAILAGLRRILECNDKYMKRAHKLRAMYLDRPIDELDDGAFYVERFIRVRQRRQSKFSTNHTLNKSRSDALRGEPPLYPPRSTGDELFFRSRGTETTLATFLYADALLLIATFAAVLATK